MPETAIHSSSYHSEYNLVPFFYQDSLPNNFSLVYSYTSPIGPLVLNSTALTKLQSFALPQHLDEVTESFLEGHFLQKSDSYQIKFCKSDTLTVWLHITNACNLRCEYCYVEKSETCMHENTGLLAIDYIFNEAQRRGFTSVRLKYAGGEPLLNISLIKTLHYKVVELSKKYGIAYDEIILSNGTLCKSEDAEWFKCNNIALMISIDGIGKPHDMLRKTISGNGSFAQVEYSLEKILLPCGIHPTIGITITPQNACEASHTVEWCIQRDLPFSINFYRGYGTNRLIFAHNYINHQKMIDGLLATYKIIEKYLPLRPFLNGLLDRVRFQAHSYPCGCGQNYLAVNINGSIHNCHMLLNSPTNQRIGIPATIKVDDKHECQDCIWKYQCAGGCPLESYSISKSLQSRNPYCEVYRALIPKALHLEGLRLLKLYKYI